MMKMWQKNDDDDEDNIAGADDDDQVDGDLYIMLMGRLFVCHVSSSSHFFPISSYFFNFFQLFPIFSFFSLSQFLSTFPQFFQPTWNQLGTMKNYEISTWNHEKPWISTWNHEKPWKPTWNHEKPWKPTWNHKKNYENRPGTMENQLGTMKNPKNRPGTMKNQPGTMKEPCKPT